VAAQLSAVDARRLNTWVVALAETYLHSPAFNDTGDERRYDDTGLALQINRISGAWFSFSLGQGSWSAFELLCHMCRGNADEAHAYAVSWLAAHAGQGAQRGGDDDTDEAHATRRLIHAARARDILARQTDIAGDDAADVYLNSRRLHRRPEGLLGFLRDSRAGEHALTAKLSDKGRVTGVLVTHIDALKGKSVHEPVRQRFDLEPARGAIFEIKPAGAGKDTFVDVVVAEGVEDGLSIYQLGDRPWRIVALPGIACLEHFQVPRATRVLIVADGDDSKSASARSLQRGIDHLINDCGAEVKLATAARGEDANSYLTGHSSTAPLLALITSATPAKLGPAGEAERLSRLDPLEAAAEVSEIAGRLSIPVADLRKEIARCRRRREKAERVDKIEAEVEAAAKVIPKDVPWSDPVPPLAELLDACLKEIKRFLWLPTEQAYSILPLWCLHTHFVHHEKIRLPISPRLGLRSETENAGKTTALDVVESLSATAVSAASITASVIFRLVDRYQVACSSTKPKTRASATPTAISWLFSMPDIAARSHRSGAVSRRRTAAVAGSRRPLMSGARWRSPISAICPAPCAAAASPCRSIRRRARRSSPVGMTEIWGGGERCAGNWRLMRRLSTVSRGSGCRRPWPTGSAIIGIRCSGWRARPALSGSSGSPNRQR
jgi:hypothetical protein